MGFDPDEFLGGGAPADDKKPKGGGFDPDAFLSASPSPAAEPSTWDRVKQSVSNMGHTVASGAGAVAEGLRHPIDTITSPERRREVERGVGDVVTLGLANKLAAKVDPQNFGPEAEQQDAAAAPGFRAAGNLGGMFLPSPSAFAAGKVASAIPGTGALAGAARAGAAYETMALPAAVAQAPEGHRLEAAADAATDPAGLALGVGLGAGGGALARGAERVGDRISKTRGAVARRLLEERGGAKVGLTTPGSGGVFDRELAGVGVDDRAVGTAAERGGEQLVRQIKADHAVETSRPFKELKARIDNSPMARETRDVTPLVLQMQQAVDDLETPTFVRAQLKEQLQLLEKHRARLPDGRPDPEGAVMLPERQLNGLRRELMRQAKVGTTDAPGSAEAPLRAAAFEAKKMVDEGPYARLNELFSAGAKATTERRKLLGLKSKPAADEQVDFNKARLSLQRGEEMSNSNTAGAMADRIKKLREQNPSYGTAIDLPALARARNDLAFHVAPAHGGLMNRAGGALAPMAAGYGMLTHPLATAGGLALMNKTALEGRVLAPIGQKLQGGLPTANPAAVARLIQAARAGASRANLQAQADRDGVPPELAANLIQNAAP